MKKTRKDIQQDVLLWILRPLVALLMRLDAKRKITIGEGVNLKRKEPYIMLANHTFLFDVIHVPMIFKKPPFIIASRVLFKKNPTKFLVMQVAHVIAKSKGESDTKAVKDLLKAIKRGYPILIFPEGNTTFYGETGHIEQSTMKLIKKLKLDVITCNVKGGYLSKPRWATSPRKKRSISLSYELTISKNEFNGLSIEQISNKVKKALYNNDYSYQKKMMIEHPGRKLAEGIENAVYACPFCEGINTIETSGNTIKCSKCDRSGFIDKYGFINNFKFDNLIDWNNYQKKFSLKLRQGIIESSGIMSYIDVKNDSLTPIGAIKLKYQDFKFEITGAHNETIPISEISNAIITLRRDFSFSYDERSYLIKLDAYGSALLRIVQDKY